MKETSIFLKSILILGFVVIFLGLAKSCDYAYKSFTKDVRESMDIER